MQFVNSAQKTQFPQIVTEHSNSHIKHLNFTKQWWLFKQMTDVICISS